MSAPSFTVHPVAEPSDGAGALAATSDGSLWCVLSTAGAVLRVDREGRSLRIPLSSDPADPAQPVAVAAATDDSVWVTDRASNRILLVGAHGIAWSAAVPTADAGLGGVVGFDDGSAWFVEERADAIGRVDILGRLTEFDTGAPGGRPSAIASDGSSVWFSLPGEGAIAHGRGGDSRPRLIRLQGASSAPSDVSVGTAGNVWFADAGRGSIARLDRKGAALEFALPGSSAVPGRVSADSLGGCWFTVENAEEVGHVDADGRIVTMSTPEGSGVPRSIVVAPSGDVWVSLDSGGLVEIRVPGGVPASIQ